ncbi:MAG TPA: hypothetical protein VGE74_30045 [Gemmata sp.]
MSRFRDNVQREWSIVIDVVEMEKVHQRTGVTIWHLLKDGLAELRALQANPILFVRVLYVLCEGQAEKLGVTPEQFGRGLSGDALSDAYEAFLGAYADFSPSHLRPLIRQLMAKSIVDQTPSDSATNSPESSVSIPAG